jgi:hypothetical protein
MGLIGPLVTQNIYKSISSVQYMFVVRLVMLVPNSSERWRVTARFSSFVCKCMFSGVSFTILQSRVINIASLRFVISLLKQISNGDLEVSHD